VYHVHEAWCRHVRHGWARSSKAVTGGMLPPMQLYCCYCDYYNDYNHYYTTAAMAHHGAGALPAQAAGHLVVQAHGSSHQATPLALALNTREGAGEQGGGGGATAHGQALNTKMRAGPTQGSAGTTRVVAAPDRLGSTGRMHLGAPLKASPQPCPVATTPP
jgi:hypothetical protein